MIYIIDGYNLLFYLFEGEELEQDRHKLLSTLNGLAKAASLELIVVFDSHSIDLGVGRERFDALEVLYSDLNQTADEHILELLSHKPKRATVVSSDKTLLRNVKDLGVKTKEIGPFYLWLKKRAEKSKMKNPVKPLYKLKDPDHDRYLKIFEKRLNER